jgi:hypothetical protein
LGRAALGTTTGDVIRKTRRNGTAREETNEENKEEGNRDKIQRLPRFFGVQGKPFFADGMATFKNTLSLPSANATNLHGSSLMTGIKTGHLCMEPLFFSIQNCFC